jgi:hypothetical protein
MLAAALAYLPALDVRPEAAFVRNALRTDSAIAFVQPGEGLFGYAGRLHRPVPSVPLDGVQSWCKAHPGGILLTRERHEEPAAGTPFMAWPYLLSGSRRIAAWRMPENAARCVSVRAFAPPAG